MYKTVVCGLFVFSVFLSIIMSCNENKTYSQHPGISAASVEKGKTLAATYCQSCHALPEPSSLDSKSWMKGVLPVMGPRLGIFEFNGINYPNFKNDLELSRDFYPSKPLLKPEEWQSILDYYEASSPDTLIASEANQQIIDSLPLFEVKTTTFQLSNPAISCVRINEKKGGGELLITNAPTRKLYRFNSSLNVIDSFKSSGPIVDIEGQNNKWLLCNIGVLNPNNGKYGSGQYAFQDSDNNVYIDSSALFDKLARPVQISACDLNADKKTDYLVCEFGYFTGALSWMENTGNGYRRHVLRNLPGAIKAYVKDYNLDGLPDIWVLFAQGEEGVFLFTNKGEGAFDQKEVLRFPPVYGSSYFELADFNNDGYDDIIYSCGDNADYSMILKPYHGIYIFINNGSNQFKQTFFYHINGCYKAIPRDYDNDGDLDIATISFFADYTQRPEEGFVYLRNDGDFRFKGFSIPETIKGRWLTMDAGDVDGDGRIDLVLGNFSMPPTIIQTPVDWTRGPAFLFLRNTGVP